jgi:hypothetical protein
MFAVRMIRRSARSARYVTDALLSLRRIGREMERPAEVVCFEGPILLDPPDAFGDGQVLLKMESGRTVALVEHLYDELEVPSEDDLLPHVTFTGRVVLEVYPDDDAHWFA